MSKELTLLLVSAKGVRTYAWRRGALTYERAFGESEADLQAFAHYLKARNKAPLRILADLPDEGFRIETIPPSNGADRRNLIALRLAQFAPSSPYVTAVSLGHAPSGRGDERLLLASLNRTALITPWLRRCEEAQVLVESITSPPLLLSRAAIPIGGNEERYLLYTQGEGGLRQTCCEHGHLQFSRLVGPCPKEALEIAAACRAESQRVLHYWNGSTAGENATRSCVLLPASQEEHDPEHAVGGDDLIVINLRQLEAAHGLPAGPTTSQCDHLLLHLLAKDPASPDFAPAPVQGAIRHRQWQRGLWGVTAACALLFLAAAAAQWVDASRLLKATKEMQAHNQALREQGQALLDRRLPLPATPDTLRSLDTALHQLTPQAESPVMAYREISRALDLIPELELERIDWRRVPAKGSGATEGNPGQPENPAAVAVLDLQALNAGESGRLGEAFVTALQTSPGVQTEVLPANPGMDGSSNPATDGRLSVRVVHPGSKP